MINPKFVFARYNEDVSWIYKYPKIANNAIIYNKGNKLKLDPNFDTKIIELSNDPSYGREGDTHLTHIIKNYDHLDDYTIFSQMNPFDHSPEFIEIVLYMMENQIFKSFQPLTLGWKIKEGVPPLENILYDTSEYINRYKLYMEIVNTKLDPINYKDRGIIPAINEFKKFNQIVTDNILPHIYNILNIKKPYCGYIKFNYGGIFGVSKQNILQNNLAFYTHLQKFIRENWSHGYIIERIWYTIFS
jgi:hypothetical protein